jgi:5-deoxy-glucuronate isomerase
LARAARSGERDSAASGGTAFQRATLSLKNENVVRSRGLKAGVGGELVGFSREAVGWEWMSFAAHRLLPGDAWTCKHPGEETACVVLSGVCSVTIDGKTQDIGERKSVFDGLPYTVYVAPGSAVEFKAKTICEIAECHVPSTATHPSRIVTPRDVFSAFRGGGNASRQVVDVMRPDFPGDRLMVIEVYTPGGNWSSYPPHKHEVHNPPQEVDLDEIYYYRANHPNAFALQRLYSSDGKRDIVINARDNDVVLVRDGFHPVVAGPGYDIYYLNFLAGSARALSVTEDSDHVWLKSTWKEIDPRLPVVALTENKS